MARWSRPLPALLLGCMLPACTLVDQNTFNPRAGDAPVMPQAPKTAAISPTPGPPPLVVIAPGSGDYVTPLRRAVAAARARKPGVLFDVVEMQPPDLAADAPLGTAAAAAAQVIVAQGVAPGNVRLAARPEAGVRAGEVRIYVR